MSLPTRLTPARTLALLLPIALFGIAVRPMTDPDIWWHLRTGQWIAENMAMPPADFFSWTVAGTRWVNHEWLGEIALYGLYRAGGMTAIMLAAALAITLTFVGVYRLSELRPHLAVFTTLLAALATTFQWDPRFQWLSLLLLVVSQLALRRARRGDLRWLALFPVLVAVWANLHAGVLLGLIVLGSTWVGDTGEYLLARHAARPSADAPSLRYLMALALSGCASAAAMLLNPYGLDMYRATLATYGNQTFHKYILEWHAPNLQDPRFIPFVLLWVAFGAALLVARRRPSLTDLIMVAGFGLVSWQSARNVPILAVVIAPVITRLVANRISLPRPALGVPPRMATLNALVLVLAGFAALMQIASTLIAAPAALAKAFPVAATDFLLRERPAGPLLNSYNYGGYLIWRAYPAYTVYIDGRAEFLYSEAFVSEYYERVWRAEGDWQAYLDRQGIRLVMLESVSALAGPLGLSPRWERIYADDTAVLFRRTGVP